VHILSVDVEDYFQVEAFADIVDRSQWEQFESRVEVNTRRMLDLLDEAGATATFFALGWIAERHPRLLKDIAARGHELGCHSYWHRLVHTLSRDEFADDTRLAKDRIEQAAGVRVIGYRAPTFSITKRSLWALEVLAAAGFVYDSSIFPIRHDVYGIPDAPRAPFRVSTPAGDLLEFPITTFRLPGAPNLPVGGGGFLRLLPLAYTRYGLRRAAAEGLPVVLYVHPWELDPDQPRIAGRLRSRLRHYTGLSRTAARLKAVLQDGRFTSFRDSGATAPAAHLWQHASLAEV
jgi:polysaccharide deacetylase family protein (PEP-CTERM system associated)